MCFEQKSNTQQQHQNKHRNPWQSRALNRDVSHRNPMRNLYTTETTERIDCGQEI